MGIVLKRKVGHLIDFLLRREKSSKTDEDEGPQREKENANGGDGGGFLKCDAVKHG